MTEQWLSIVEYARTYNLSDMTVRRRIKTGRLRAVLKDGKYYIPVTERKNSQEPNIESSASSRLGPQAHAHLNANVQPHAAVTSHARPSHAPTYHSERSHAPLNRPRSEMVVVKGQTQRTFSAVPPAMPESNYRQAMQSSEMAQQEFGGVIEEIPSSLARPLLEHPTASVDAKALLAFCEASMRKVADSERRTVEKFKAKLVALEAQIERKDLEISVLRQQVEDLQLLAKILEKRS